MQVAGLSRNANFIGLLFANTILGVAMPMLLILGGLTGLKLAPTAGLATLPASVQTLAGLLAAAPFSLLMGRFGRRTGFAVGGGVAIVGALAATYALLANSFVLLCAAHFVLGAALSSFQYFRFAAAEVVRTEWQPVAISLMLTSGLVAAIAGPEVFIIAKDALPQVPLAGAYAALAVIVLFGIAPLSAVRIPRQSQSRPDVKISKFSALNALKRGPVCRAVGIAAVAQSVMILLMIPTPLAMIGCGFSEDTAGDVIRWHIVAMFAPSFVTGFLIKRFGAEQIAIVGLVTVMAAGFAAAAGLTAHHFYGSLILLGVGWNFSFIGATSMLASAVTDGEKAAIQGINDTIIALVSTVCAFAAGLVVTEFGWGVLAFVTIAFLLLTFAVLALFKRQARLEHV